jgi:hypothetical protein
MRAPMPNFPCSFEIPDEWWIESGMTTFTAQGRAYRSSGNAQLVPLEEIEPLFCKSMKCRDWCGFDRERMIRILNSIASGDELKPVPLVALPYSELPSRAAYAYRALDGFHRFYASIAAGFECLPASVIR